MKEIKDIIIELAENFKIKSKDSNTDNKYYDDKLKTYRFLYHTFEVWHKYFSQMEVAKRSEDYLIAISEEKIKSNEIEREVAEEIIDLVKAKNNSNKTYVVFDLETTGLKPCSWGRIIEIAAVKVKVDTENNSFEIYDEFHALINPAMKIPKKISKITGITTEMVEDKESIYEVLPQFVEFIEDGSYLSGHNIKGFDIPFLDAAVEKFKFNRPDYKNKVEQIVDTLYLSRKKLPSLENHKLKTIADYFSIPIENHHRAIDDARANAQVLIELLKL
ncbi:DNA polymerase III epsilon subunit family exonuclease [Orenia metallireducens]|jgi:DNA polymerase III epsilon subunit family exonuclease|uniref:Exonuclease, DNA polymerase III, epsilon subunit family n=1 Tax=Orenia metallireducens TaxID=1413210 RepID=A0A285HFY1_9FIRM|nr:3'-5' exonuclease [Orenia metallireducens]PRX27446.1 DNA polymerase III epsilon subunit family exonuclease [Orenia metallireducens]SNY34493.1 exonuclease, DNA polymerase III, epsilon subunit family [Orenia metallireducens]